MLLAVLSIIFITGCSKQKYMTCTIELENNNQNYTLNAIYKVYYKDKYVTKIEKEEIYKSDDKKVLDYFNEYKNLEYNNLNDIYGGFEFNVNYKEDTVKLNSSIDMSVIDVKKMVANNYLDKNYVVANKLTTSGAKYFYSSKGASCDI